ncbi:MAG: hypothetical protein JWM18_5014 [Chloroflexi bacterium]|jgi:hypothetical protein|nr:hypothetical protein [Chloroflexota bacterium]
MSADEAPLPDACDAGCAGPGTTTQPLWVVVVVPAGTCTVGCGQSNGEVAPEQVVMVPNRSQEKDPAAPGLRVKVAV